MHALVIYILAACNVLPVVLQGFYWGQPQNNIVRIISNYLVLFYIPAGAGAALVLLVPDILFYCYPSCAVSDYVLLSLAASVNWNWQMTRYIFIYIAHSHNRVSKFYCKFWTSSLLYTQPRERFCTQRQIKSHAHNMRAARFI